jgi:hypothetical protein
MGKLLKSKEIRRAILRLMGVLHDEGHKISPFEALLWRVFDDSPLIVYVDDAWQVTTFPKIPIEVVFTAEM